MLLIVVAVFVIFAVTAYAVTEQEVQQQVASSSKEAVSGNVFIWFLCAIAFLKISQTIDSFMASLGISVGHTGGSMMAEALMLTRGIGAVKGGLGGFGFGRSGGSGGGSPAKGAPGGPVGMSGGLAGVVSRQFQNNAIGSATGTGGNFLSNQAFNSSLKKDGAFANGVIGAVAKGNISQIGSITGDKAPAALSSYLGFGKNGAGAPVGGGVSNPAGGTQSGHGADPTGIGAPAVPPAGGTGIPSDGGAPLDAAQALENGGVPPAEPSDIVDSASEMSAFESAIGGNAGVAAYTPVADEVSELEDGSGHVNPAAQPPDGGGIPVSPPSAKTGGKVESDAADINGSGSGKPKSVTPDSGSTIPVSPYSGEDGGGSQTTPRSAGITPGSSAVVAPETASSVPKFENVEIGGGRITGREITPGYPQGRDFAMYHTDQYTAPKGQYETVSSVDNSKWYKQYAVDAVEKTPKMGRNGKIEYNERIVQVMPPTPRRKDKI